VAAALTTCAWRFAVAKEKNTMAKNWKKEVRFFMIEKI
jgi:hypothetical protein